jgi:hypothetical protein
MDEVKKEPGFFATAAFALNDTKKVLTGTKSRILFLPGAGVTPAEGSVKPTAGFTFD